MVKVITIYKLIGLIKDGKAPKRIIYDGDELIYKDELKDYRFIRGEFYI